MRSHSKSTGNSSAEADHPREGHHLHRRAGGNRKNDDRRARPRPEIRDSGQEMDSGAEESTAGHPH